MACLSYDSGSDDDNGSKGGGEELPFLLAQASPWLLALA